MTKPTKQRALRPPVDALQYEKLALSAFELCDRQMNNLDTLISLAASLCRSPAITNDERHRQRTMLELLVQTGEQYQQELACDRELFQVIALDAKGVAHSRITANQAARLLTDSANVATQDPPGPTTTEKPTPRKRVSTRSATIVRTDTTRRRAPVRH
ncbi:hypothetical protein [Paraburkholderia fynbosensis]|uniref:Uncharacterized protein n=1 Tax=Paraburkholderia fynbosensis TaxID=1200993 RepID=A0A6J5FUV7_9BURK|nr:hypothetical protein [Paraburkholderia fynbosensis]CAB3785283.1 hypothetical protein LMG27177_01805 [Paraburkholderia fynbosensis]